MSSYNSHLPVVERLRDAVLAPLSDNLKHVKTLSQLNLDTEGIDKHSVNIRRCLMKFFTTRTHKIANLVYESKVLSELRDFFATYTRRTRNPIDTPGIIASKQKYDVTDLLCKPY